MYTTSDGSTQLYLFVAAFTKLRQIKICLKMDANSSATVDWGDGTTGTISNDTSYAAEVYAEKSDYAIVGQDTVVCIKIIGGSYVLGKSGNNRSTLFDSETPPVIMAAHIGEHCHGISENAFCYCASLKFTVIPQGVTSIGNNVFYNCTSLASVVIPQGVTSIGENAIRNCDNLYSVDLSAIQSANQIPTLADSATISNTVAIIWVYDSAMITAFEAATNWSTFAGKYAVKG